MATFRDIVLIQFFLKWGANSSVRFHVRAELLKPNHARSHGHASSLKGFIVKPVRD